MFLLAKSLYQSLAACAHLLWLHNCQKKVTDAKATVGPRLSVEEKEKEEEGAFLPTTRLSLGTAAGQIFVTRASNYEPSPYTTLELI
jgi:hypothetical protein